MAIQFDDECFFIAPIGADETAIRKRSDGVRDWVVKPAARGAAGLTTVRADDVGEPGQITAQAIQHCLKAKAAVADLTGGNPNVYYELSVRHGALLPVVLIAEAGTKLPFDISQSRVIFFDHTDLTSAGRAREELESQIKASLIGTAENPISDGMRLAELQAGNAEEKTLASLLDRVERMSHTTDLIDRRLRNAEISQRVDLASRQRIVGAAGGRFVSAPVTERWWTPDADQELLAEIASEQAVDDLTPTEKAEIEAELSESQPSARDSTGAPDK